MPTASTIIETDLHPILAGADRAARRFCRKHARQFVEHEDIRQELLLDLLSRLHQFDARRSPLRPFVVMCFAHRLAQLLRAARREHATRHPVELDAPVVTGGIICVIDNLAESDGFGTWIGQPTDQILALELRLDFDRALSAMAADVVPLCAALLRHGSSRRGPSMSRTTLHRRKHDLRCRLLAAGIGDDRGTIRWVVE